MASLAPGFRGTQNVQTCDLGDPPARQKALQCGWEVIAIRIRKIVSQGRIWFSTKHGIICQKQRTKLTNGRSLRNPF